MIEGGEHLMPTVEALSRVWNHDWEKEGEISREDYEAAARVLYHALHMNALAHGETDWSRNPQIVAHLGTVVPLPVLMHEEEKDKDFSYFLEKAMQDQAGIEWNPDNFVLVPIPHPVVGAPHFVVFDRSVSQT